MKTWRAEVIETCEAIAEHTSVEIIAYMPRMAEFYRKRANEQLRAARASGDAVQLADAKAKLEYLRWVDGWTSATRDYRESPADFRISTEMSMIGYSLRYLIQAYADHPQFRQEWALPTS